MRPHLPAVLVAEANHLLRETLGVALGRAGLAVVLAENGRETVELYKRHRDAVRLVLLDVRMPLLDGPQALAALRQLNAAVRVCFMTGDSGGYSAEDLANMGALRVFRKPFGDISVFAEEVRQLVG